MTTKQKLDGSKFRQSEYDKFDNLGKIELTAILQQYCILSLPLEDETKSKRKGYRNGDALVVLHDSDEKRFIDVEVLSNKNEVWIDKDSHREPRYSFISIIGRKLTSPATAEVQFWQDKSEQIKDCAIVLFQDARTETFQCSINTYRGADKRAQIPLDRALLLHKDANNQWILCSLCMPANIADTPSRALLRKMFAV